MKDNIKTTLLPLCTFAQWVPNTDVLVSQAGRNLVVWYNIDNFQNPKTIAIKGNVEEVKKSKGKYEVYINESSDSNFNSSLSNFSTNNNNTTNGTTTRIAPTRPVTEVKTANNIVTIIINKLPWVLTLLAILSTSFL